MTETATAISCLDTASFHGDIPPFRPRLQPKRLGVNGGGRALAGELPSGHHRYRVGQ